MKIAGIIRKSPTNSGDENKAVNKHKDLIYQSIKTKFGIISIDWYIDVCSGDDEIGRKELHKFFKRINDYDYAYCYDVDRFSRSWLGLKWFHQYFIKNKCKLVFLDGTNLYRENGNIDEEGYMFFFIKCAFAEYELMKIRNRTKLGRDRIKSNPELRKIKYAGGKKGRTWKWN